LQIESAAREGPNAAFATLTHDRPESLESYSCKLAGGRILDNTANAREPIAGRALFSRTKPMPAFRLESAAEIGCVFRGEFIPLLRQIVEREDSRDRADRNTSATVDALDRIDIEQRLGRVFGIVLLGMNAIHRTRIHARGVFGVDAGLGNHVSHKSVNLLRCMQVFYYYRGVSANRTF